MIHSHGRILKTCVKMLLRYKVKKNLKKLLTSTSLTLRMAGQSNFVRMALLERSISQTLRSLSSLRTQRSLNKVCNRQNGSRMVCRLSFQEK